MSHVLPMNRLTAARRRWILPVLVVATLTFSLEYAALPAALPNMAHGLHTSVSSVVWVLTSALLVDAVMTPVIGRLGDMFGQRRMLLVALAWFAVGGLVAAVSGSLPGVIVGRVLQGVGSGVFPLSFALAREAYPTARRTVTVGLLSTITGLSVGVGPVLGGLIVDHAGYRWIFGAGALLAVVAAGTALLAVPESANRRPGRVDVWGAGLLAAGITLPLLAVSQARTWGWASVPTIGLAAGGVLVLAVFVLVELRRAQPLVNIRAFVARPVLLTNLAGLVLGVSVSGELSILPRFAETPATAGYGFSLGAAAAGLLLLPGSVLMLVAGPLSGALSNRLGARWPFVAGGAVIAAGLALLTALSGTVPGVIAATCVFFVGIGLTYAAMPNLIINAVPAANTGEATGMNSLMRSVGAAIGTQVLATMLAASTTASPAGPQPADTGYLLAFGLGALLAVVSTLGALAIPRARADQPTTTPADGSSVGARA